MSRLWSCTARTTRSFPSRTRPGNPPGSSRARRRSTTRVRRTASPPHFKINSTPTCWPSSGANDHQFWPLRLAVTGMPRLPATSATARRAARGRHANLAGARRSQRQLLPYVRGRTCASTRLSSSARSGSSSLSAARSCHYEFNLVSSPPRQPLHASPVSLAAPVSLAPRPATPPRSASPHRLAHGLTGPRPGQGPDKEGDGTPPCLDRLPCRIPHGRERRHGVRAAVGDVAGAPVRRERDGSRVFPYDRDRLASLVRRGADRHHLAVGGPDGGHDVGGLPVRCEADRYRASLDVDRLSRDVAGR